MRTIEKATAAAPAIEAVAALIREEYRPARALIVTGSAARNEATIALTAHGERWLSDLEFLVVVPNAARIRAEVAALDRLARRASLELARNNVHAVVELTPAPVRYFERIRPHLFGYELRECGRQIGGTENYLARIPRFNWREIPLEDAWRLTSNRIVEWLEQRITAGRPSWPDRFYALSKQYLDLVTSLSLFSGRYAPSYGERAAAVPEIAAWIRANGPEIDVDRFERGARLCWKFKSGPVAGFEWLWDEPGSEDLAEALDSHGLEWFHKELPEMLCAVWRWQSRRAGKADGFSNRLRGWAKLALRERDPALLGPFLRLFWRGSPRSLVYECAFLLAASCEAPDPATLGRVRGLLPAPAGPRALRWRELASSCAGVWRHLRRSGV